MAALPLSAAALHTTACCGVTLRHMAGTPSCAAVAGGAITVITVAFVVARYSQDPVNILRWILLMAVAAIVVTVYLTVFPRHCLPCWHC